MNFRQITSASELIGVNRLIRASKSHWGYTEEFLDNFMNKWGVCEDYLRKHQVIVMEDDSGFMGIYTFLSEPHNPEIDHFFIHPDLIGQGLGRELWNHAMNEARDRGWGEIRIISDPNAEDFYIHMGAVTQHKCETFPGRFVPDMRMVLN